MYLNWAIQMLILNKFSCCIYVSHYLLGIYHSTCVSSFNIICSLVTAGLLYMGFIDMSSPVLGSEHGSTRGRRAAGHLHKVCLVRDIHTRLFCSSGSPHPIPLCSKEQILVLIIGWCPSTTLSRFPTVNTGLLVSPPCSGDCAGKHSKPSWMDVPCWRSSTSCATWMGCEFHTFSS